jgi:hypothetical protein
VTKPKIRIVSTADGDWKALYLNGKSVYQGHDITVDQLFSILKANNVSVCLDYDSAEAGPTDSETANAEGRLPVSITQFTDTEI